MTQLSKLLFASVLALATVTLGNGQCASWLDSPQKEDAENAHSIYRQALKDKDYVIAFENWEKAFSIAPAADGKRDYHFTDGAQLYLAKYKTETDAAKKEEYKNTYISLIDQALACYRNGSIVSSKCPDGSCINARIGYLAGRKAFDMFYTFNTPYTQTTKALKMALENSGDHVEYIVYDPYASIAVYQFQKGKMEKAEARAIYEELNDVADFCINKNNNLSASYQQAKESMNAKFAVIANDIFDCEFFVEQLKPEYEDNIDDPQTWKRIVSKLKGQGCALDHPFLAEVESKYKVWAKGQNAAAQAEFEANNPSVVAKKLYDQGKFSEAIAKYNEAIATETDLSKKGGYQFSKASIQYRKLKSYGAARATALAAAKNRPGWGRPYMLIGDMYGSGARSCGDSWNQRLAILAAMDKYRYAKSVDASVAKDADSRLSKYRASMPSKEDGFQRGIKEGSSQTVGCWIAERVKVRYAR